MRYEDALEAAVSALRSGEDLEAVLARLPQHAEALRDDLRLASAVARYSRGVAPRDEARRTANARLLATLQSERTAAQTPAPSRPWFSFGWPRFVLATAVVLAAFAVFAVLNRGGGGSTVEAATIEGVVLGASDGTLTVQTLDAIEEVAVPPGAPISDAAGARLELTGIAPGEVVLVHVQRRDGALVARQVERLLSNLEAWCNDASERCDALTQRLEQAEAQCNARPLTCRAVLQHVNGLRLRAQEAAHLERLKLQCRTGQPAGCRLLAEWCRENSQPCAGIAPLLPNVSNDLRDRVRGLIESCQQGDPPRCRELVSFCESNPGACPPMPRLLPNSPMPTNTPQPRSSSDAAPTATPSSRLTQPTPAPQRDAAPTPTPASQRDVAPTPSAEGGPTRR